MKNIKTGKKIIKGVTFIFQNIEDSSTVLSNKAIDEYCNERDISIVKSFIININGLSFHNDVVKEMYQYVENNKRIVKCIVAIGITDETKIKELIGFTVDNGIQMLIV